MQSCMILTIISYFTLLIMAYEGTYSPPSCLTPIVLNSVGNTLNSGSLDDTGKASMDFIVCRTETHTDFHDI